MPDTAHVPTAVVTNPLLLWLFAHGWESPDWGQRGINQAALGLALHSLSDRIANHELQAQLRTIAEKVVTESAHAVVAKRPGG